MHGAGKVESKIHRASASAKDILPNPDIDLALCNQIRTAKRLILRWTAMSSDGSSDRIKALLTTADTAIKADELQKAAEALREASHLDADNAEVKERWTALQRTEEGGDVYGLLQKYLAGHDDEDGKKALQILKSKQLPNKDAIQAIKLLLHATISEKILDDLTGALLSRNVETRKLVARRLKDNATEIFELLSERGEESFNAFSTIPLENAVWSSKSDQAIAQKDVFRLCVATLIEAGAEHLERVMRCAARLLSLVPDVVTGIVDADVFDAILSSLDLRLPASLRSQAILATSKLLEATKQQGEELFSGFITQKAEKQTNNDLIIAFSAAAAVFPIIPAVAAKLFLIDGFVQQLVPNLERNWEEGAAGKRYDFTLLTRNPTWL